MILYTLQQHHFVIFFFFNDTATTEIYTLSLHDALPISDGVFLVGDVEVVAEAVHVADVEEAGQPEVERQRDDVLHVGQRSEEHTSELQSRLHLVCRLLLEKKKRDTEDDTQIHTTTHMIQ